MRHCPSSVFCQTIFREILLKLCSKIVEDVQRKRLICILFLQEAYERNLTC